MKSENLKSFFIGVLLTACLFLLVNTGLPSSNINKYQLKVSNTGFYIIDSETGNAKRFFFDYGKIKHSHDISYKDGRGYSK